MNFDEITDQRLYGLLAMHLFLATLCLIPETFYLYPNDPSSQSFPINIETTTTTICGRNHSADHTIHDAKSSRETSSVIFRERSSLQESTQTTQIGRFSRNPGQNRLQVSIHPTDASSSSSRDIQQQGHTDQHSLDLEQRNTRKDPKKYA